MDTKWSFAGGVYRMAEQSSKRDTLPAGIYSLDADMQSPFLAPISSKFELPTIFGKTDPIINRVIKQWKATKGNLGVMLTGHKGGGKTLTAKILSNAMLSIMPTLVVSKPFDFLPDYLLELPQDILIYMDEYEKVFDGKREALLLTTMDGVHTSKHRRLFLMTSNELTINHNLKHRPGRIRYIKEYGDLPPEVVREMLDKLLIPARKRWKEKLFEFIKKLELITFDAVSTLIHEVNIHNEGPDTFAPIFNLKKNEIKYQIYRVDIDKEGDERIRQWRRNAEISNFPFTKEALMDMKDRWVYANDGDVTIGRFVRSLTPDRFVVNYFGGTNDDTEVIVEVTKNSGYHSMYEATDETLKRFFASAY